MAKFEYKFVRLKQDNTWLGGGQPSQSALDGYEDIVHRHANEGWRLVQIFAPGIGVSGQPTYIELILERQRHD